MNSLLLQIGLCFSMGGSVYKVREVKAPLFGPVTEKRVVTDGYYSSELQELVLDKYRDGKRVEGHYQWARIQLTDDLITLTDCPKE